MFYVFLNIIIDVFLLFIFCTTAPRADLRKRRELTVRRLN